MLNKISNFSHATKLDLILGYYNILFTNVANKVCTITTPFGNYTYNCLPGEVCIAPDIFQERMSALMDDLELVGVYINDFLVIISGSFEEHLA